MYIGTRGCNWQWTADLPTMKVLMFSMCLEARAIQDRVAQLGRLVLSLKPDFIALQNVNLEIAKNVLKMAWGARYHLVQPNITYDMRTKPCNVIFSAYPPQDVKTREFEDTEENRSLFYAYFVMYDKKRQPHIVTLANVRLDTNPSSTDLRESQLNQTLYMLREEDDAIVLGDMNLHPKRDGDLELYGGWQDAWLAAGRDPDGGNTVDPSKNSFIVDKQQAAWRPDRIFFRLSRYQLESVEMVGTQPFGDPELFISEHFGLVANLVPCEPVGSNVNPPATDLFCSFNRP